MGSLCWGLGPGTEVKTEGVGMVIILPKSMGKVLQRKKFPREIVKTNKTEIPCICLTVIFGAFFLVSFDLTAIE